MAKNTSSSAFRKIDIDQYNEDNFKEDEAEQSVPTGPDEGEVCSLLNHYESRVQSPLATKMLKKTYNMYKNKYGIPPERLRLGKYVEALKLVLSNAPLGTTDQTIKDGALALTLKVLLAIKSAQIEEVVGTLSRDDIDILMKYIYRGFEYPSEGSSGHLLLWHEKAFNIGGSGSIVRVLSDRMKV